MKVHSVAAGSMLVGIVIGSVAVQSLQAQTKAPIYLVGEIEISDSGAYSKEYLPRSQALIKQHGGRAVAAGAPTAVFGEPPKSRVAIYAWDSMDQLMGWFNSQEYQETRKAAEKYAKFRNFSVPGVAQ